MKHSPVILDVAGLRLTTADKRRLTHPLTGGVILFSRNWESRAQLTALCSEIRAVRADLLICIDHEGGRVQRFKTDGFTHVPAMRSLGELWMGSPANSANPANALKAMKAATACGYVLASELRACGVDFSFTPVLDLDWGGSGVIGDRALATDANVVSVLAKSVMHGLLQAGMGNCGKHFPGHGFVKLDSHVALPVDKRSLHAILKDDALPYAHLNTTLTAVMPAHVIYAKVDERPAGFSKRWLEDILREQLQFAGAIISDDLSMTAARQMHGRTLSFAEAAVAALNAGCDLVLVCNQSVGDGAMLDQCLEELAQADWLSRPGSEERRLGLMPKGVALLWDDLMVQPAYMQALESLPFN